MTDDGRAREEICSVGASLFARGLTFDQAATSAFVPPTVAG